MGLPFLASELRDSTSCCSTSARRRSVLRLCHSPLRPSLRGYARRVRTPPGRTTGVRTHLRDQRAPEVGRDSQRL